MWQNRAVHEASLNQFFQLMAVPVLPIPTGIQLDVSAHLS